MKRYWPLILAHTIGSYVGGALIIAAFMIVERGITLSDIPWAIGGWLLAPALLPFALFAAPWGWLFGDGRPNVVYALSLIAYLLPALVAWSHLRVRTPRREWALAGACLGCGYDLTGNTSGV